MSYVNDTYQALISHVFTCEICVSTGVNCGDADEMARTHREAKRLALLPVGQPVTGSDAAALGKALRASLPAGQ
ncbi:hypothetical protein [Streptomyces sp. ADI93-02]|uniref:hypothetical protein n=1 Tax=Streptomyces sp. ADI93-02 TaxID=1522757 RepID=UPI000F55875C|nr:hypothetical protein [Streptomyces sp. ADI93-02]RPK50406.1 hypothetical protein EES40_05810 [Streptomyces sp. ADI93-02]